MCKQIAIDLGFDMSHGRLDVSVHPFTGGPGPDDVRMTTRYKADDLTEGISCAQRRCALPSKCVLFLPPIVG